MQLTRYIQILLVVGLVIAHWYPMPVEAQSEQQPLINCWDHVRKVNAIGGGVVPLMPGCGLDIAPRSLEGDTIIWAKVCEEWVDGEHTFTFELGPSGTTFDPPAILTFFNGPQMEELFDTACFLWDPEEREWVEIEPYENPHGNQITFVIEHFSLYAVSSNRGEGELELSNE